MVNFPIPRGIVPVSLLLLIYIAVTRLNFADVFWNCADETAITTGNLRRRLRVEIRVARIVLERVTRVRPGAVAVAEPRHARIAAVALDAARLFDKVDRNAALGRRLLEPDGAVLSHLFNGS